MSAVRDRVGLAWRRELAAAMLARLDEIDVLEAIAEDWLDAPRRELDALADLARARPLLLHGVALGLASCEAVDRKRLDRMARLVGCVAPHAWSEHLAFVRAAGVEIGHLAAPPRTPASVEGALANIARAQRVIGSAPRLENIATLIDPPASTLGEGEWIGAILREARVPMLLDLHNLYANALNFGTAPLALLRAMPLERVEIVHLAGGRWIEAPSGGKRLLDDHLHDVPADVYSLLEELAALVPQPLTVVVERDGRYPPADILFGEIAQARAALARGRARALVRAA